MHNRCHRGECIPDKGGYCIYCRHEVLTEVDSHGIPVECTGDSNCPASHHYEGCFAMCMCTETQIVHGCSLHDNVHYT